MSTLDEKWKLSRRLAEDTRHPPRSPFRLELNSLPRPFGLEYDRLVRRLEFLQNGFELQFGNASLPAARTVEVELEADGVQANGRLPSPLSVDRAPSIRQVRHNLTYLLSQGADPMIRVPGDDSAILVAAELGDPELMNLLLDATGK